MTNETKPTKPDDYLTVTYSLADSGEKPEPKELFMSAGLIRKIASVSQSHIGLIDFYTDPSMQSYVISEILKPRPRRGEPSLEYQLEDFNITVDEGQKVANWAIEHVIYFFTEAVLKVKEAATNKDSSLTKLAVSMTGSQDSQEQKQPAGPSTEN